MMLSLCERRRNDAIMEVLRLYGERIAKMTREEARAEVMKMGMHHADGSLKAEWGGRRRT